MSSEDRSPAELSSWADVGRALADLADALGTSPREVALNRWLDEVGAPSLDELAVSQEWQA